MRDALRVQVGQAGLLAVRIGEPTEEMIEAAVLHGDDNYMVDPGIARAGQIREGRARGRHFAERP